MGSLPPIAENIISEISTLSRWEDEIRHLEVSLDVATSQGWRMNIPGGRDRQSQCRFR